MRHLIRGVAALGVLALAGAAQGQTIGPSAVYDDFGALGPAARGGPGHLDPAKWSISESTPGGTELVGLVRGGQLHLRHRALGRPQGGVGVFPRLNVNLLDSPATIAQIQATFVVQEVHVLGCTADPNAPTQGSLRLEGVWFNTGVGGPPPPNSSKNDVFASIRANRNSTSTDPPGVLTVSVGSFRCDDAACIQTPEFFPTQVLGKVRVREPITLRLRWDPANDRFVGQLNQDPEVAIPYTAFLAGGDDVLAPGGGASRRIRTIENFNCAETPAPSALVEAVVDEVAVARFTGP